MHTPMKMQNGWRLTASAADSGEKRLTVEQVDNHIYFYATVDSTVVST